MKPLAAKRSLLAGCVALLVCGLLLSHTWSVEPPSAKPMGPEPPKGGPDKETQGLDEALRRLHAPLAGGNPLSPQESLKRLKAQEGLAIDLVASEPVVRQPLALSWDERGRLWVMQYLQYPFPAGLKILSYDQYIRARFDKVPPPPPKHFKGADKITIHSSSKHDGVLDQHKTFVEGLNIATSVLHGRGGLWVMNPPYLLFYPDKNRDDVPDGDPVVHLSGFGLEDTHAVASNLMWGPDGWIYGTQGSTCTAKVKVEIGPARPTTDFLGQAIWRYHPEKHLFELYAEGGGNTFGLEFDDEGRIYSGTNWGTYRGLHYVQGGYYVKGWGKHGPLTNPYAFGYFPHMPHTGNADRLTHTFVVYGGGALPERFNGRLIGPSPLQKRVQATRLEPLLSSYRTIEEPFVMTSGDGWFRPVDCKVGPDGALYLADMYENRISHVDPRDNWHRESGRIYRIRSADHSPALASFDLGKLSSKELVDLLTHKNRWYRQTARRLLADRKDKSVAPRLREQIQKESGLLALESLWALHVVGARTEADTLQALGHKNPAVRAWAARLAADERTVSARVASRLVALATKESDPQVRSQLASSARRIQGPAALPVLRELLRHDEDVKDPHIPLLLWWALEAHAESARQEVVALFKDATFWKHPLVEGTITERLMQRYGAAGGKENLRSAGQLLELAPTTADKDRLLVGLEKAFTGRAVDDLPDELKTAITRAWAAGASASRVGLGLRIGHEASVAEALRLIADGKANPTQRQEAIRILGEVSQPRSVPVLLNVMRTGPKTLQLEALTALQRYDEKQISKEVLAFALDRKTTDPALREGAISLLSSRPAWSLELLQVIDGGKISPRSVSMDIVRKIHLYKDPAIIKLIEKHWGKVRASTAVEKKREMVRLGTILKGAKGNATAGKIVFTNTCGKCHKLFGEGGAVGPELTGYERDNLMYWLENIADPSAAIRDEYMTFVITTTDGRTLTGLIAEQDKQTVTLKTAEGQAVRLSRSKIEDLRASLVSLMPEDQLKPLTEQQVRDLFAYLSSKR